MAEREHLFSKILIPERHNPLGYAVRIFTIASIALLAREVTVRSSKYSEILDRTNCGCTFFWSPGNNNLAIVGQDKESQKLISIRVLKSDGSEVSVPFQLGASLNSIGWQDSQHLAINLDLGDGEFGEHGGARQEVDIAGQNPQMVVDIEEP